MQPLEGLTLPIKQDPPQAPNILQNPSKYRCKPVIAVTTDAVPSLKAFHNVLKSLCTF